MECFVHKRYPPLTLASLSTHPQGRRCSHILQRAFKILYKLHAPIFPQYSSATTHCIYPFGLHVDPVIFGEHAFAKLPRASTFNKCHNVICISACFRSLIRKFHMNGPTTEPCGHSTLNLYSRSIIHTYTRSPIAPRQIGSLSFSIIRVQKLRSKIHKHFMDSNPTLQ